MTLTDLAAREVRSEVKESPKRVLVAALAALLQLAISIIGLTTFPTRLCAALH